MKKFLMIALMALPFAAMSQAQLTDANARQPVGREGQPQSSVEAIYVEIVVSYNDKDGQRIVSKVGEEALTSISDKETQVQMKSLSEKVFKSVPDAMAELAGHNFKFVTSYQVPSKDGDTAHLVFEKRTLSRAMQKEIQERDKARITPDERGTRPAVKAK